MTRKAIHFIFAAILMSTALLCATLSAAPKKAKANTAAEASAESEYYRMITIPISDDIALECGGMELMGDNKLAVSTRHGDIYLVEGAYEDPPDHVKFTLWATGMHEVMGLAYNKKDGYLYAVQRGEVTRLKDAHNRGKADVYETFCDSWGISGDYHEYPWMSKFDKDGNLYVLLTLTGSFTSDSEFRGWCLKITPDGNAIPYASGLRSPGGIGWNDKGELFYSENQGPWNGADALRQLVEGSFQGHPIGNKWYDKAPNMGSRPPDPKSGSRIYLEAQKIPQFVPPAIIQPYEKLGQSQSGIICDMSDGKFGPFARQMFCADQHHSNIGRFVLDKINDRYQGVCFPFREGFASGIVPMIQGTDGSYFVGGTNRGWGSRGPKEFALERLVWTGKTPFEMYDMKIKPDGFDITFTEPLDKSTAADVANYNMTTFRYIYRAEYGSPEVDQTTPTIKKAEVSADGKAVHLVVDGLQLGAVHELHVPNLRSEAGLPLLHSVAYYTLWQMP
jgi:hypothetical protein